MVLHARYRARWQSACDEYGRNSKDFEEFDMLQTMAYKAKQFNLSGLQGISDKTLEMHFKLYEGYVKSVNELNEKTAEMLKDGRVDQDEFPAYSELTRRLGFEYNGMVLHEYYFGNLQKQGAGIPASDADFIRPAET